MSSFVVQPAVINRVVSFLDDMSASHTDIHSTNYRELLAKYKITLGDGYALGDDSKTLQRLAGALWDLNLEAVQQRYPDSRDNLNDAPGSYDGQTLVHHTLYVYTPAPIVQVYKSLRCLVYQCSEGNVPNNPLYKLLEDLENLMATHIVGSLPEYEKAEWD